MLYILPVVHSRARSAQYTTMDEAYRPQRASSVAKQIKKGKHPVLNFDHGSGSSSVSSWLHLTFCLRLSLASSNLSYYKFYHAGGESYSIYIPRRPILETVSEQLA
uniref:Uncharacterized protein n=1 Tax=Triticum urartu TaxID=4572 RepID=A0A8R7QUI8_TRIUA